MKDEELVTRFTCDECGEQSTVRTILPIIATPIPDGWASYLMLRPTGPGGHMTIEGHKCGDCYERGSKQMPREIEAQR